MDKIMWHDRRRYFGFPLSFTKYALTEDTVVRETGLLNLKEENVLLYRVLDIELLRPLVQRIFGCGTIVLHSSDQTSPELRILSVKNPKAVKEQVFQAVEEAKLRRRMRTTELLDADDVSDGQELT